MTVTTKQIEIVETAGMHYVQTIARVCNELKMPFYLLLAMLEKETGTVRNVYGGDVGGALSGFKKTINKGNYDVFWWLAIEKGGKSNGVGPGQLTYKGYHTDMKAKGLDITDVYTNIKYSANVIFSYYKNARASGLGVHDSIRKAGTLYNTGSSDGWQTNGYGSRLLTIALKWKEQVGNTDYK